ncbi:MAG: phage head closure protein [Methylotenera sp.]|nr:phage head closure protein [Methylotenera sp.]
MSLPVAGELNRLISIKVQADIPAMGAAITQNFTLLATVWAKHQPVGSAIFFGTKQVGEDVTDRFIIRRNATINEQTVSANHVIEFNGNRYRVRRASDLEGARQFVMIEAEGLGNV